MKVIALYDFHAQPDTGEISIRKDEIITVTRQDIGEGWWEGINSLSQKGLFPAEYVSPINQDVLNNSNNDDDNWNNDSTLPPPPTSTMLSSFVPPIQEFSSTSISSNNNTTNNNSNYNSTGFDQSGPGGNGNGGQEDADWDSDWDDDDSQISESTIGGMGGVGNNGGDYSSGGILPSNRIPPIHVGGERGKNSQQQQPAIKKSINRFSHFVKSGGEDYILGLKTYNVNSNDYVHVIFEDNILKWSPSYFQVTVSVENPKKESKMKGLKSYIAYQLTPSDTGIPVSRRYKHFDWLHERLQEKFITIPIPSLPDKQISGRYQEDFIQNRQIQLQSWVNRICRHPVLSMSTVWKHFITCKDEKQWKTGKRRAEKDELVGGLFFLTIQIPENATIDFKTENKLEKFFRFINRLDESTKNTYSVSQEMIKRYQSFYKREFNKISQIFNNLADSFLHCPVNNFENKNLIEALNKTSETYESIGKQFEEQYWLDFGPLSNLMHEYRGILTAWPEIYHVYKGSINKKKEHQKAFEEQRLQDDQALKSIEKRADVVTYATMAEMNHFEQERINDFNNIMRIFLTGQLKLYQNIVEKLQNALEMFPETPTTTTHQR